MNYLSCWVGNRNFNDDDAQFVEVDIAYVMGTDLMDDDPNYVILNKNYDIGLIFPTPEGVALMGNPPPSLPHLRPLLLPQ